MFPPSTRKCFPLQQSSPFHRKCFFYPQERISLFTSKHFLFQLTNFTPVHWKHSVGKNILFLGALFSECSINFGVSIALENWDFGEVHISCDEFTPALAQKMLCKQGPSLFLTDVFLVDI